MKTNHQRLINVFVLLAITAQCGAAHLPERAAGRAIEQLDTIEQQQQGDYNTRLAALERHQRSSDKIGDVAAAVATDDDDTTSALHRGRREKRELSDWLIAPNTRWCGRGNLANGTYNTLGGANAADKCCRRHDHCQLYIPAMSNRFELFNYRPYTLSHCNCDRRFRTCLKMANDEDAKTIGKLFFNMVQTQCFVLRHEEVCQKRADDGTCESKFTKQKAYLKNNRKF